MGELGAGWQVGGQGAVGGVGGDREGCFDGAQGVLGDDDVAVAGQEDADRGAVAVLGAAQLLVDGGDVEGELAEVPGMMRALWAGQTDRHGGDSDPALVITQEVAETAVLLAVPLVQWFTSGAVARR